MALTPEAIIGIVALALALPPALIIVWRWAVYLLRASTNTEDAHGMHGVPSATLGSRSTSTKI